MGQGRREMRFATDPGGREVAYRVFSDGDGPVIVHCSGGTAPIDVLDEDPMYSRFLHTLGGYGRLVLFDRPGIGASDPFDPDLDILAQTGSALVAVLDDLGVPAAWPVLEGATAGLLLANLAREHRDRLAGAIGLNPRAPIPEEMEGLSTDDMVRRSDDDPVVAVVASRAGDPVFREWFERAGRLGATAAVARAFWEATLAAADRFDDGPVLGTPPMLMMYRRDALPAASRRYWRDVFPEAEQLLVDGADVMIPGLDAATVADTMGAFITGQRRSGPVDRSLAALLFTDLVGSTPAVAAAGDAAWGSFLDVFEQEIAAAVGRHGGTVVKHTGDGCLATFATGSAAIAAARELRAAVRDLGLEVRTGIHVGEFDVRDGDLGGLAIHLTARVMGEAGPGQIIATSTAAQATSGSGHAFRSLGTRSLKGITDSWELWELGP